MTVLGDPTFEQKWETAQREYGGKIRTFARNSYYKMPSFDVEDVEQELLVVLWECVVHYDPTKGAKFNTYFQQSAKNRIITLIRYHEAKRRTAPGGVTTLDDDAVRAAAEEAMYSPTTEDRVFDRIALAEVIQEHGPEVLLRTRAFRQAS